MYSSRCGAYTHVFSCMYFMFRPIRDFLACTQPVITCKVPANHWRPSKALNLSYCKTLSHLYRNFRAISQLSLSNHMALSHWYLTWCVTVTVVMSLSTVYVVVSLPPKADIRQVCLIKLSRIEIGLFVVISSPRFSVVVWRSL